MVLANRRNLCIIIPLAALALGQASPPAAAPTLRGQTEPAAKVEVTPSVHGILAEVYVREGQSVKKGAVLAKLDDAIQQTKVEQERVAAQEMAEAEITYAENQLEFARVELKQFQGLDQPAKLEVQEKMLAVKQAEVAVSMAKAKQAQSVARFNEEKLILERMTIRSPIEGQILSIKKRAGEQTDDAPFAVIVQTNKLHAIFYPGKDLFGKIAVGDKVDLDLEGRRREGEVVTVDPIIDPASQIFRVKIEVDNPDGKLAGGVNASWNWAKK
jgi:RND family efflux transporter MFP subunit